MDSINRKNGYFPGTFFKRSNRIMVAPEGVFFRIREGKMIGPFATFREAELNLREFIRTINCDSSFTATKSIQTTNNYHPR